MLVISVAATKGGVGKTTVTANLGGLLADAGLNVLMIDLDAQPTLSDYYPLAYTALGGTYELVTTPLVPLNQLISHTEIERLDVIRSNDPYSHLNTMLRDDPSGRLRMVGVKERLAAEFQYDVVLLDTQGARSILLETVIMASDLVLSPTNAELLSAREFVRGTQRMINELQDFAGQVGRSVPSLAMFFNKTTEQIRESRDIVASMRDMFHGDNEAQITVLDAMLAQLQPFRTAAAHGLPVHRLEKTKPSGRRSPACADQMKALAIEICPQWKEQIQSVGKEG
ncbi:ParA family protein [Carnimonas bestiolae]|uniref:ParA family protein n=1 Tax=Carnimonas bestiolae TaxID=3402172 RepID=UPI003EDBB9C7